MMGIAIVNRMIRESFTEVTFEQNLKEDERAS